MFADSDIFYKNQTFIFHLKFNRATSPFLSLPAG